MLESESLYPSGVVMSTWTSAELLRVSGSYWTSLMLQAAVALDVFSPLAGGAKSTPELAKELGYSERGLDMLLTALVAAHLLARQSERYALTDAARRYLCKDAEEYVGHIIKHHHHLVSGWNNLADAVRKGEAVRERSSLTTTNEEERKSFLMGMHTIARLQAQGIAQSLNLVGRKKLMDIGGGPGTYALSFCSHNPQLSAVIYDLPTSRPFAEGLIGEYGLKDRVSFMGGDFLSDPLPQGCDVAWLSQVLHGAGPKDSLHLVKRAAHALEPGGLLCIQEFTLASDRTGPLHPALFALNMLVGTPDGCAFSEDELCSMMREAGLAKVQRLDMELPLGCAIFTGVRD